MQPGRALRQGGQSESNEVFDRAEATQCLSRCCRVASIVGVCLAAVSIVVMPLLARAKRRVAARLNSRALVADSRQTDLCAYLSGILFVGLALNALFGWWWADSIAAILMVPIITRESIEALKGDACDGCH